ncbi:hypothetical protein TNIN_252001 [Trichonephila inaurata madagascariensis]|uniref:Uncharacterized protein n=1 Tax=Trichonephila inaurata madagascariensis TaxID=2747483 RepID=A0A8X6X0K7_9ARAC|nr:hypothetical protein TNIN_252001 [Trichonephila inaurata madagascariensis]
MLARVRKRYYANRHTPSADGQCQQDRTSEKFKRQARLLDLMEWNGHMCGRGGMHIEIYTCTELDTGNILVGIKNFKGKG